MRFALLATTAIGACSNNDGIEVDLQQEIYKADFGHTTGTLPTITCSVDGDSLCSQLPSVSVDTSTATGTPSSGTISVGCDTSRGRCYAQANARLANPVDVQLDSGFVGKVEGRLINLVRVLDLTYDVPANTLTFDIPSIDVYVGPVGTTKETDAGVGFVGSTPALSAGATLKNGHLPIRDKSPGHGIIENAIRNRQAFVFVLVLSPKISAGSPIPAGALEVHLTPRLTIGF